MKRKQSRKSVHRLRVQKGLSFLWATMAGPCLLFIILMFVSPEVRAWVTQIMFPPSRYLCLSGDIVGHGLSFNKSSLYRATDRAFWYYKPEQNRKLIRDPHSPDAELWRTLYMRQIACRIEERKAIDWSIDDEDINRALRHIHKTRREFEILRPSLLWANEAESQIHQVTTQASRNPYLSSTIIPIATV